MLPKSIAVMLLVLMGVTALAARAADVEAITRETPWRVFMTCGMVARGTAAAPKFETRTRLPEHTAFPPAGWAGDAYDDSAWGRYGIDVYDALGGYGYEVPPSSALLCLRTRFGVADPALVKDLALALEYRGGVVVYINGSEIARQHLPKDKLEPMTFADDYPAEAFVDAAGTALPAMDRPATANADRYEQRIRKLEVAIPAAALRKGGNVLAIELHRTTVGGMAIEGRGAWGTVGLCAAKLASKSGAGVVAYADAASAPFLWNATPMDTIANTPGKLQSGFLWNGITVTPAGLARGNPFDPLQPIRAVAPRGGLCSGQVVVSAPAPLKGLTATIDVLKHVRTGAAIPAESVQVRFAAQEQGYPFCDGLQPKPTNGASTQPVWVLVDVPRDQAPGWYTSTLTVTADGKPTRVPVQVLVAGWTLTDPKDNATLVSMYQSPETLAAQYKVAPWSDEHFALIEKSMRCMAKMGNDVLLVPIVLDNYLNHKNGMVRWVRKGDGYEPDFAVFERYLDLQTKVCGRPKIVTLSVWKHDFGTRTWFRGMNSTVVKPCMVTELDPKTGVMKPMQAPHFGEPGSEEFWKTMIEGVRRIVKARGIDGRSLLLGEAFDSRPLEATRLFFEKIEPGMRWQIYSHFDGGEPRPKDGKFVCHGGFEVGFRINPNGGELPEFTREYPKVTPNEFLVAQAQRTLIQYTSSPLSYRDVMRNGGTIARIGADFWPVGDGRAKSLYGCPPNEGWLWRGHVPTLTMPGPDGAVPTTRGQNLVEGVQETEVLVQMLRALPAAKPEVRTRIQALLSARGRTGVVGGAMSQAAISLDWLGMSAREYALAAELAGEPSEGDWAAPPAVKAE